MTKKEKPKAKDLREKVRQRVIPLLFYPTLGWNMLWHRLVLRRAWWNRIDDRVILGALPLASMVDALAKEGVGGVVNTCREYEGPLKEYAAAGIEQLRLPTYDFTPPTLEHVREGVEFMQRQIAAGRTVYVHCKAGRARSATIVMCWLIAEKSMTPEQAQAHILERRPHAHKALHRRAVVQEFHEAGKAGSGSKA